MLAPITDEDIPDSWYRAQARVPRSLSRSSRQAIQGVNEDRSLIERFIVAYMFLYHEDRDGAMRVLRRVHPSRLVSTIANFESRVRRASREARMFSTPLIGGVRVRVRRDWDRDF